MQNPGSVEGLASTRIRAVHFSFQSIKDVIAERDQLEYRFSLTESEKTSLLSNEQEKVSAQC